VPLCLDLQPQASLGQLRHFVDEGLQFL